MDIDSNVSDIKPFISIVTPSYNASSFIKETIHSVQSQTYNNWEMIIVDDVSKDNTRELIKEEIETDNRIRLIELTENSGAAIARNTGINNAKGKYVAFLDSDDLWLPEKLEKQLEFMQNNDIAFSFTSYQIMNQDGILTDKVVHVPEKINYNGLLKNTITIAGANNGSSLVVMSKGWFVMSIEASALFVNSLILRGAV